MADDRAEEPVGFGPRLRKAREALGLSQRDLSHRTGIAVPVINRYETGERTNPGRNHLRCFVLALGVSADYLCETDRDDGDLSPVEGELAATVTALDGSCPLLVSERALGV